MFDKRFLASVLGAGFCAAALYAVRLDDWSLWLDEATSLYFSEHREQPFAKSSSAYFALLDAVMSWSGGSVAAGRAISAAFGGVNVALVGVLVARCTATRRTGLIAAALFGTCLLHVFWSQSIRYYTMLLTFELIATLLLLDGILRRRTWLFPVAGAVASFGLWVHFSGALMLPAWGLYLAALGCASRRMHWRTCLSAALLAVLPFAAAAILRYPAIRDMQASGGLGVAADAQRVTSLAVRYGLYLGAPMCALAAAGAFAPSSRREGKLLLAALAVVPIAETVLIAVFGSGNVTIHHGMLAAAGCAGLAAMALDSSGMRYGPLRIAVSGATVTYYALGLVLYFTVMHGDRPRWKEAAEAIRASPIAAAGADGGGPIYSTGACELSYYLGAPADQLLRQTVVAPFVSWEKLPDARPLWVVVDARSAPAEAWQWLEANATRVASFEARTGPRDRTVAVFRIDARPATLRSE